MLIDKGMKKTEFHKQVGISEGLLQNCLVMKMYLLHQLHIGRDNEEMESKVVLVGKYARAGVLYPVEKTKFILKKI